ncbi:MAG TPA: ABC transporter permease [Jiangellaceae bacterium]|nr:ABC transporter permease [Jiangellaceae bacterium]
MTSQLTTERPRTATTRALRRVRALSAGEMRLLWRNRTAVFTAVGMPAAFVLLILVVGAGEAAGDGLAAFVVLALVAFVLLFVAYYNLVTAYVARREGLVLKRLRTTEATDREILLGTAVPAIAVSVTQVLLAVVAAVAFLDLGRPVNPLLVIVGLLGGLAVFALLAAASTAFTRSVEIAQITTLPVVMVSMVFAGLFFPLDMLPDLAEQAAKLIPLTPVVELVRLGLTGATADGTTVGFAASFGEALVPVLYLVAWTVLAGHAVRRWFRWEPRT